MASTALQISPIHLQPTTLPPGPGRPPRPTLRLIEGGRAPSRLARQATFRRRRLLVGVVLVAVVAAVLLLASAAMARIAGGAPSSAAGASSHAPASVVVHPGDTLWSIAAEIAPEVDIRITVDQLVAINGSAPLVVGQALELPG